LGDTWKPINANGLNPSYTLNGILAQLSNSNGSQVSLDLIKVDHKTGSLVKFKSDYFKGIASPAISTIYYFNNQIFVVSGNTVYSKPLSTILAN